MQKTLMIVDDSQVIRNRIERHVLRDDWQVVAVAHNGVEAIELYKQHRPYVVTMDLTMPEMDGLACIGQICDFDPEARILVVSALSDKATGIQALKAGAQGFLYKPFTDEELREALSEMIAE